MATPTLASLLTTLTQSQAFTTLLNYYQTAGFPTTTWQAGDIDLTRMQAFATALNAYVTNYIPAIAGGSLLDYAPNYPGWTALTAQEIYNLPQNPATYTQGTMTATNTSSSASYSFASNQLYVVCPTTGNRYINSAAGTIQPAASTTINEASMGVADTSVTVVSTTGFPTSGTIKIDSEYIAYSSITSTTFTGLTRGQNGSAAATHANGAAVLSGIVSIPFQAENPGASYADASNLGNITLVTPLPGVTMSNPANSFSTVTHVGSGTGTLTLSGTNVGNHSVVITITATSTTAPAALWYTIDGGALTALGAVSSVSSIGSTGITVTLNNGAIGTTSWVVGDTYSFSMPGSWITSQGANVETDTALATRCRNRWSSLSIVPTSSLYQFLAQSTPTYGSQVTQVYVVPDSVINNKVNIVISGPGGVLPSATISAVQAYITPRSRGTDNPVVSSPTTQSVAIAATVTITAAQSSAAQSAITVALNNYIAAIGINGTVRISAIVELIMLVAGVIDVTGVTLNGTAANVTLGGAGSFVLPVYPPPITLTVVTQ